MKIRLGFLVGFGAGYVMGAKAGTERYEQLRRLYENVLSSPAVREARGKVKGAAETGFDQARDLASDGVQKVKEVKERKSGTDGAPTGLSVAPPPVTP
ncbi:MAG: YtxH domain-containing protein [Actinobacteria bacterium]|nr:YtxH domain-containing protein [Actinomycetota bacterium]